MIPAGYMAKKVARRPDGFDAPHVHDIFSVSNCISGAFMEYIDFWRHNGYWYFNNPHLIQELALEQKIDLDSLTFFYYEIYEKEFDEELQQWLPFEPDSLPTQVAPPANRELQGYDVVTYSVGTIPECSPLSCNYLAGEIETNAHCLLELFEEAKKGLESGAFGHSEPGPFRIFAVYTVDPNHG